MTAQFMTGGGGEGEQDDFGENMGEDDDGSEGTNFPVKKRGTGKSTRNIRVGIKLGAKSL